ncbi:MAG: VCBS repeat-containing protein, partial [Candidatus Sabulitectum sp.]|nr:VCBS repeat-containing protein [Candidatus Sabulitectum sp.]
MKSIMFVFICCLTVSAGEAVQTDWSGGASLESVVTDWGDGFSESLGISSTAVPGIICLSSTPFFTTVERVVNSVVPLAGMDAGDLDGDGFIDLVGASVVTDHVIWFRNLNGSSWSSIPLNGSFDGALGCSISDVDGDGYPDVLGGMDEPDMVVLWKNTDGSGPAGDPVVVDPLFPGVHCVIGCDVDGDDMMDIMGAANQCHQIAVWYNLGNDTWEKVVIDSTFTGTQSVSPGDFDGDGDIDAAGAALGLGEFAWWENPGNRTDPWNKHLVADGMTFAH